MLRWGIVHQVPLRTCPPICAPAPQSQGIPMPCAGTWTSHCACVHLIYVRVCSYPCTHLSMMGPYDIHGSCGVTLVLSHNVPTSPHPYLIVILCLCVAMPKHMKCPHPFYVHVCARPCVPVCMCLRVPVSLCPRVYTSTCHRVRISMPLHLRIYTHVSVHL